MASGTAENAVPGAAAAGAAADGISRPPSGMPAARPITSANAAVVVLLMPSLRAGIYCDTSIREQRTLGDSSLQEATSLDHIEVRGWRALQEDGSRRRCILIPRAEDRAPACLIDVRLNVGAKQQPLLLELFGRLRYGRDVCVVSAVALLE